MGIDRKCLACGDEFRLYECEKCKENKKLPLLGYCLECHLELRHDTIQNQNIHIVGGINGSLNSGDKDPDAYAPAWKQQ